MNCFDICLLRHSICKSLDVEAEDVDSSPLSTVWYFSYLLSVVRT